MSKDKPFIMKDTQACETALQHWLKTIPYFNVYSFGWGGDDYVGISLNEDSKPDSDWGKLVNRSGRIICRGDDKGFAARERAFKVIRKFLNYPAEDAA
jgi:hypothetical protein